MVRLVLLALTLTHWAVVSVCGRPAFFPHYMYGTAWKTNATRVLVLQALDLGFRAVDTACQPKHYDEAAVGQALRERPDLDVFVQTKYTFVTGQDPNKIPYDGNKLISEQVVESLQLSLKHLGKIDSWLLHGPYDWTKDTLGEKDHEAWDAMSLAVDMGLVGQIGVCNINVKQLKELAAKRIPPSVVQVRCEAKTRYQEAVRRQCDKMGIPVQCYGSIGWNRALLKDERLVSITQRLGTPRLLSDHRILTGLHTYLAKEHGDDVSPAQMILRYLRDRGTAVLAGPKKENQMRETLATERVPSLAVDDRVYMSELGAAILVDFMLAEGENSTLRLFWVAPDGALHPQGTLNDTTRTAHIQTSKGHVFRVVDEQQAVLYTWTAVWPQVTEDRHRIVLDRHGLYVPLVHSEL